MAYDLDSLYSEIVSLRHEIGVVFDQLRCLRQDVVSLYGDIKRLEQPISSCVTVRELMDALSEYGQDWPVQIEVNDPYALSFTCFELSVDRDSIDPDKRSVIIKCGD